MAPTRPDARPHHVSDLLIFLFLLSLSGCERGCARTWLGEHGVGRGGEPTRPVPPGAQAFNAIDCPDGLARCSGGVVEVSRLATIQQPCRGTPQECSCPWEREGECDRGCVADDLVVVVDQDAALRQVCAPEADATPVARLLPTPPPSSCDEDVLFRCAGNAIVACADHAVVAVCAKGCVSDGASLGDDVSVSREAAFALLCTR
ncbi:MAG TPA: hypothetical protein VGG39_03365 [Polyangiaceae bacterium]|jgi:hypothetical protein